MSSKNILLGIILFWSDNILEVMGNYRNDIGSLIVTLRLLTQIKDYLKMKYFYGMA